MAYVRKTWVEGERILETDLNNIEAGIESADLTATEANDNIALINEDIEAVQDDVASIKNRTHNLQKIGLAFKTGSTILLEWFTDNNDNTVKLRFYGGTMTLLTDGTFTTSLGFAGVILPFTDGAFLCVNLSGTNPALEVITITDMNDLAENTYIIGHMEYIGGNESVTFIAGGSLINSNT